MYKLSVSGVMEPWFFEKLTAKMKDSGSIIIKCTKNANRFFYRVMY